MSDITEEQAAILVRMVEDGYDTYALQPMMGGEATLAGVGGGPNHSVKASDVRELADQGYLRPAPGDGYEVTEEGRAKYQELKGSS